MHHQDLEKEIKEIIDSTDYSSETREDFTTLLEKGQILRDEGSREHFCVYFLPYNPGNKKVLLVNHKKAAQWLSPGGHIDSGETLLVALNREIREEMGVPNYFSSLPKPFYISTVELEVPNPTCVKHYDIWFLFKTDGSNFKIDLTEFLETRWISIEEARKMVRDKTYPAAFDRLIN